MVRNNEGLTKTYNRFHDPDERSPDILKLRELHAAMDRAVLDAYGWTDLKPTCEFLLDYEEDEDEDESARRPPPQEALALPLARRLPRRSPRPPPRTQPPARRGRAPERPCCRGWKQGPEARRKRRGRTRRSAGVVLSQGLGWADRCNDGLGGVFRAGYANVANGRTSG